MVDGEERRTIEEELTDLGIEIDAFDEFYGSLGATGKIPDIREFGHGDYRYELYSSLFDYFRSQNVLDGEGNLNPDDWKLFMERRDLEVLAQMKDYLPDFRGGGGGGIMPCRREDRGGGGVMPCRY
jgi:hypothetical protein